MRTLIFFMGLLFLSSLRSSAAGNWSISESQAWVTPGVLFAEKVLPNRSNNNVSIERHDGVLFVAFRSSKNHFASNETITYVAHSVDDGKNWILELAMQVEGDVREALLKSFQGVLHLFYFEGGTNPGAFEPKRVMHRFRNKDGTWSRPVEVAGPNEVVWDLKIQGTRLFKVSYAGPHYRLNPGKINVKLEVSDNGFDWQPVDSRRDSVVYSGGVSEVSIEFDSNGDLWGVGRNEDGDDTGFGTQIFFARRGAYGEWTALKKSLPERYDSPRLFSHQGDVFLLSRRCLGPPFDRGWTRLPFNFKRWAYLGLYSLQKMRTALFRLNRSEKQLEHILDIPSAGDTGFPSITRDSDHQFSVANYTSPLIHPDRIWITGQTSGEGTSIYSVKLKWSSASH